MASTWPEAHQPTWRGHPELNRHAKIRDTPCKAQMWKPKGAQELGTSGAMYSTVPTGEMGISCLRLRASPKSPSFMRLLDVRKMFSSFTSLRAAPRQSDTKVLLADRLRRHVGVTV